MQIPIARYRFTCVSLDDLRLPFYSGSALRGAFGYMLRKISCLTKQPTCTHCPLRRTCPYSMIFEPEVPMDSGLTADQALPAYILEPLPLGQRGLTEQEEFCFNLVLLGPAIQHLALLIYVWEQIFSQGIRKPDGKAQIKKVEWLPNAKDSVQVYSVGHALRVHDAVLTIPVLPEANVINIEFLTPTRIRSDGARLGPESIQVEDFFRALNRRYRLLMRQYQLPELPRPLTLPTSLQHEYRDMHWLDWTRYSSRQEREMTLGGLVGVWHWSVQDIKDWWAYLYVGQWLHVGKNAAFGMGHYHITVGEQSTAIENQSVTSYLKMSR
ncbi:CRISPR system precrRNA processing endoribonuclease RAMP protein Cas6 [Rheinheimera sp.]|uniref:CRISPR system precrRNA processing endoribonuclease RAMP protein Cas6 n=1 Tax=Rheinheimera sp. TaxID=1869214 RepID=UPI003AF62B34